MAGNSRIQQLPINLINGDAIVYKDINVGGAILLLAAANKPDIDEFKDSGGSDTGISTYAYAVGELSNGSLELQHDYKEGTDLYFHIHWQGITPPTGEDNVNWELTYTLSRNGQVLGSSTVITKESGISTQYEFITSEFDAINGASFQIGDQFLFKIRRVAASAEEYAGDALVATVGIHYELNTVGSFSITSKE